MQGHILTATCVTEGLAIVHTPKAYSALVGSLEVSLSDEGMSRPKLDDDHWDEYYLRDMCEKFCLLFLNELVNKYGPDSVIKARFVERWLAKQNWGDDEKERQKNFAAYINNPHKLNRIGDIVKSIRETSAGMRQLRKARLISKEAATSSSGNIADGSSYGVYLEITMGTEDAGTSGPLLEQQGPRNRDRTAAEQRRRRQHREAVVISDGTRPIGRQDIIEREHSSPT